MILQHAAQRIAHAKINLNLHVVGRRADGYHELQSLVVFGKMGDRLRLMPQDTGVDRLSIDGPFAHLLSTDEDNLVLGALQKFRQKWPHALTGPMHIHLQKNLPVAAGIGGGSADAAAILFMLNAQANIDIEDDEFYALALELGADVPVCLASKSAIMEGIGERITPVFDLPELFCVLVNPMKSVSTAKIFTKLERIDNAPLPAMPKDMSNLSDFIGWLNDTRNDLEQVACKLVPEIEQIREKFNRDKHCIFTQMSGSGASVVALYASEIDADNAALDLSEKWQHYWVQSAPIMR